MQRQARLSSPTATSIARRYFSPSDTNTIPGVSSPRQCRSCARSFDTSEYTGEICAVGIPACCPASISSKCSRSFSESIATGRSTLQPAIEQCLRDTPHSRKNLRISKRPPPAIRIALRRANPIRRDFRPFSNAIGENLRISAKRLIGTHQQRAVRAPLNGGAGSAKPHMPHPAARFFQSTRRTPSVTHDWP